MKKKILSIIIILLSLSLNSQEKKLFAPFPSRINVEKSASSILITWKDASDLEAIDYEIFRSLIPIMAENLDSAEMIGAVAPGVEAFIDNKPADGELFYAVFARDANMTYKICIPYRNVTTSSIINNKPNQDMIQSTKISDIRTQIIDSQISISLISTLEEKEIMIFRSTDIIESFDDLRGSTKIMEIKGRSINVQDDPIPGIAYYYAAVDSDLFRNANQNLLYEGNYTKDKIMIDFTFAKNENGREIKANMPLPLLNNISKKNLENYNFTKSNTERDGVINQRQLGLVNRLIGEKNKEISFQQDKEYLPENEQIQWVISDSFKNNKWEQVLEDLAFYTSDNVDKETRLDSHFYRGQAYYFLGDYNKSMIEFIMIEKERFNMANKWIEIIYSIID